MTLSRLRDGRNYLTLSADQLSAGPMTSRLCLLTRRSLPGAGVRLCGKAYFSKGAAQFHLVVDETAHSPRVGTNWRERFPTKDQH